MATSEPSQQLDDLEPEFIEQVVADWSCGVADVQSRPVADKILPIDGQRNILVTAALPYVNNVPHLGTIVGCVLSADVYSRFCRLRGYNTLYVCGTDEYGTATETKAIQEGLTPQQVCEKYHAIHKMAYDWFNCSFDYFGRTTTQLQTEIAQEIFWQVRAFGDGGYTFIDSVEQFFCDNCQRFLADRLIRGDCPHPNCTNDDARGDQCDKCGKLLNANELVKPRCATCQKGPPRSVQSNHIFMNLRKLQPILSEYLEDLWQQDSCHWSNNAQAITRTWLRDGLKPRCITRDLKWGTPVPLEGFTDKVFYVWFDAPIGYMSITANYTEDWRQWWQNHENVELCCFVGKDNVPFHSVIFPSTLLGAKRDYTVVKHLSATEYLNYEDTKFSKSRGVGVFADNAKDTGIPADVWRFYLMFIRPESQDTAFNWTDFATKVNSELLNNLGNFVNRALSFCAKMFNKTIPKMKLIDEDKLLLAHVSLVLQEFVSCLEKIQLKDGIRHILSISRLGNQYMQGNQPWVKVKGTKEEQERAGTVIGVAANLACLLSVLLRPYMPDVSDIMQKQLQAPSSVNAADGKVHCLLPAGHVIGEPSPLFQRIEDAQVEEFRKRYAGAQVSTAANTATKPVGDAAELEKLIAQQGDVVRGLKSAKAEKAVIDVEVKKLLELKTQLAAAAKAPQGDVAKQSSNPAELDKLIAQQGDKVRKLKTDKADKSEIDVEVKKLLELKSQLASTTGGQTQPVVDSKKPPAKPPSQDKSKKQEKQPKAKREEDKKADTVASDSAAKTPVSTKAAPTPRKLPLVNCSASEMTSAWTSLKTMLRDLNALQNNGNAQRTLQTNFDQIARLLDVFERQVDDVSEQFVKRREVELLNRKDALQHQICMAEEKLRALEVQRGVKQYPVSIKSSAPSSSAAVMNGPAAPPPAEQKPAGKKGKDGGAKPKPVADTGTDEVTIARLDMRVGKIVEAWKHPDADGLYVERVDLGEETQRTVVSGLVRHVPVEEMQNRMCVFLCNLKPAKMRGVESQAMVMCASTPEKVEILVPPSGCSIGDRVLCPGYDGTPDAVLNPKKKVFETVQPDLLVNTDGAASYKGTVWKVMGRDGQITAPSLRNVSIK